MKKLMLQLTIISILHASPCAAEDFKVDTTFMEAVAQFKVLNVGNLAVGEKGLVSIYGLRTCIENSILKVASISKLDSDPTNYSYAYEVSRNPDDRLSVTFSHKGKKPDIDAVQEAIFSILSSPDCAEVRKKDIPLFSVTSFLGAQSLKALVSELGVMIENQGIENISSDESVEIAEPKSSWIVTDSKSPIDDSPSSTLIRMSESGSQALVLRCNENTTYAYINTEDYLNKDSVNVTVRFDQQKAKKQLFKLSTDRKALFFGSAITNIKSMMESDQVVIRYYSYRGATKTVIFKLDGLNESITSLRAACKW